MGALHGPFGALTAELLLRQSGDHDRQFVWRQGIGVMQHRGHRQVLATHGPVDHHLQAFDGGKDVDGTPVAARTIVVKHQRRLAGQSRWCFGCAHEPISSALAFLRFFSAMRRMSALNSGCITGGSCQTPASSPTPTLPKKSFMASKRA